MSGPRRHGLGPAHQVFQRAWISAKGHAAGVNIGAGDVQLIGRDAPGLVEPLDHRDIVADRVAEDVDDDIALGIAGQGRSFRAM